MRLRGACSRFSESSFSNIVRKWKFPLPGEFRPVLRSSYIIPVVSSSRSTQYSSSSSTLSLSRQPSSAFQYPFLARLSPGRRRHWHCFLTDCRCTLCWFITTLSYLLPVLIHSPRQFASLLRISCICMAPVRRKFRMKWLFFVWSGNANGLNCLAILFWVDWVDLWDRHHLGLWSTAMMRFCSLPLDRVDQSLFPSQIP